MDNFLKKLIREEGYTYRSLGTKIGVPWQTIASWVTGKGAPKYDSLVKLSEALNVPIHEITGDKQTKEDLQNLTEKEKKLLNLYRQLDEDDRADLCATARVLLRHEKYAQPKGKKVA